VPARARGAHGLRESTTESALGVPEAAGDRSRPLARGLQRPGWRCPLGEAVGMIDGVTNADAIPVLERLMQFTGRRHRLIVHNVANLDTPQFRPADVSVKDFQAQLGEAIDRRRAGHANAGGRLDLPSTRQVTVTETGLDLHPSPVGENILFHDGNDRNPERIMQSLVENFITFRTAADLLKSRFNLINTAISERV
jgi:flagellar basal-body rod protein FlgB